MPVIPVRPRCARLYSAPRIGFTPRHAALTLADRSGTCDVCRIGKRDTTPFPHRALATPCLPATGDDHIAVLRIELHQSRPPTALLGGDNLGKTPIPGLTGYSLRSGGIEPHDKLLPGASNSCAIFSARRRLLWEHERATSGCFIGIACPPLGCGAMRLPSFRWQAPVGFRGERWQSEPNLVTGIACALHARLEATIEVRGTSL